MISRRALLQGAVGFGASGCFRLARPAPAEKALSPEARAAWRHAWAGLDARQVLDTHVHVVGTGEGGTGCWVNPAALATLSHPVLAARFAIYKAAAGVEDDAQADSQYLATLTTRAGSPLVHGRFMLLAFDRTYDERGTAQPQWTEFFTPNTYVNRLARERPDLFVPCASVHPYRQDALEELERAVEGGAIAVKWLPNAMRIDPSSERCDRFYEAMTRLRLPLLTHAGEEKAVDAGDAQRLGNPLHLRRPLEHGVRVIVAHCASLGQNPDFESPGMPWVDNFDLFARLMDEPRWEALLFGEISAMAQANRAGRALEQALIRSDWHPRLLNGSDYPLPAINVLVQTRVLKERGFISSTERSALNELDQHNPLMFDFVLKRMLKVTRGGVTHRFAPEVFTRRDVFPRLPSG